MIRQLAITSNWYNTIIDSTISLRNCTASAEKTIEQSIMQIEKNNSIKRYTDAYKALSDTVYPGGLNKQIEQAIQSADKYKPIGHYTDVFEPLSDIATSGSLNKQIEQIIHSNEKYKSLEHNTDNNEIFSDNFHYQKIHNIGQERLDALINIALESKKSIVDGLNDLIDDSSKSSKQNKMTFWTSVISIIVAIIVGYFSVYPTSSKDITKLENKRPIGRNKDIQA